jgi:AraC family transcriptional regulator
MDLKLATFDQDLHHTVVQEPAPMRRVSGNVLKRLELPALVISDNYYPRGLFLTRHAHEHSYFTIVAEGRYSEQFCGTEDACYPNMVRFLPAREAHANNYFAGARCLQVQLTPAIFRRVEDFVKFEPVPGKVNGAGVVALAHRIQGEFKEEDQVSPLAIECLILELMVEMSRSRDVRLRSAPAALRRARNMLQEQITSPPSLTELARILGMHPVHLCREFRRFFGCTMSDYIRQVRIERAQLMIGETKHSLSEIAQLCGFYDQSHFGKSFKKVTGITPIAYRSQLRRK